MVTSERLSRRVILKDDDEGVMKWSYPISDITSSQDSAPFFSNQ
jgi:hypothetical protein